MSDPSISGKVCVVTGGSRGLGRAMTISLCAAGARVVAPSHIAADIPIIEADVADVIGNSGGDVYAIAADLRNSDECKRCQQLWCKNY